MKLADNNIDNKSLAIGILVVPNFYWEVMLERFIKGKSEPVVFNTKLGYVLSDSIKNSHQVTHQVTIKVWHEETVFKTDISSHDILDADFDYESPADEKIKFKTEQKRFEIDFPFKDYLTGKNFNGKKFRRKKFLSI